MSQYEKILLSILSGTKDKNVLFTDLRLVLDRLGFQCRIRGDHFIYTKDGVEEIITSSQWAIRQSLTKLNKFGISYYGIS